MINAPKLLKTNQMNVKFSLPHIDFPESISDKLAHFSLLFPKGVVKSHVVFD